MSTYFADKTSIIIIFKVKTLTSKTLTWTEYFNIVLFDLIDVITYSTSAGDSSYTHCMVLYVIPNVQRKHFVFVWTLSIGHCTII